MQRKNFLVTAGIFSLLFGYSTATQAQVNGTTQSQSTVTAPPQTSVSTPVVYSLQQCVDSALKNNPTVKTSEFTKESAKVNWDQQRATMLPYITSFADYLNNGGKSINNYNNTYVTENYNSGYANIQATLTLWNGSSIRNFIRQYALNYKAAQMDLQQAKDLMTVNVILAYLNVLSNEEQLSAAKAQAEVTRGKVKLLEMENNEGAITPSTLSDMKGQLGSDELAVVTTQNAVESNKLALAQFMNVPYSPDMEIQKLGEDLTPMIYGSTVDQIYQNAVQNLAQVKAANLHEASAEKAVKATRGNMMPTLQLVGLVQTNYSTAATGTGALLNTTYYQDGSYTTINGNKVPVNFANPIYATPPVSFSNQVSNNLFTQFGVQLNIPIITNFRLRTLYRQSRINLEQAKFNATTTITTLKQSVESYYVTMMNAYRTYNTLFQQEKDYGESFRAAEIRFNAGAVSVLQSLDYLTAKNNIDRTRISLIQAKYNYILQTKILDYFQGKLTW